LRGAVIARDPLSDDPEAVVFEFGRELVSAHVAHKAAAGYPSRVPQLDYKNFTVPFLQGLKETGYLDGPWRSSTNMQRTS
jgi:hypothetical protein